VILQIDSIVCEMSGGNYI